MDQPAQPLPDLIKPGSTAPPASLRLAVWVLGAGSLLVVLAAGAYDAFELDRFFVPKELVLHATAFCGGLLAVRAFGRVGLATADRLLLGFLAVSALSALFATNGWVALRALAVSVSGITVFWVARTLAINGLGRRVAAFAAAAVVLGAITSLLQTYGVRLDVFSPNRAPGGTLGNRNFVAHMCAFGLPVVLFVALAARRRPTFLLGAAGAALVTATLVLTRSRAGWLAFAAAMAVLVLSLLLGGALRRSARTWARLALLLGLAAIGVAGGVLLPNSLRWRTANPYAESMRSLTEHREGSGRGRLVQYEQSLRMSLQHPLLGVGPGNWPVEYPGHARRGDPSMDGTAPGMTANPWPSSDWVALLSERGPLATLLLLAAFALIAWRALLRLWRTPDADEALASAALLATLAAAAVAGVFDAVLLLALPTLLVWASLGALGALGAAGATGATGATAGVGAPEPVRGLSSAAAAADPPAPSPRFRLRPGAAMLVLALAAGAATVRSAGQLAAIHVFDTRTDTDALRRAAAWDPGNYRLRVRLARATRGDERCEHARAANALFPHAQAGRQLAGRCR